MSTPVYQLTVAEAHKEYSSLMDKIAAKYQQLDSSKFGAVGTPAFDAKFKNWELVLHLACNYPCCLTSPRKLTKQPPWTAELLNPQDRGLYRPSLLGPSAST